MSILVVDACVGVKWFFDEIFTKQSVRILENRYKLHAPDFFLIEFTNLLCKRLRRREITKQKSDEVRKAITLFPIDYYDSNKLLDSAYGIAVNTGSSLYDGFYLALAVLMECPIITSDKRLFKNISKSPFKKHILWIEDID